jgi:hypothetical protein
LLEKIAAAMLDAHVASSVFGVYERAISRSTPVDTKITASTTAVHG